MFLANFSMILPPLQCIHTDLMQSPAIVFTNPQLNPHTHTGCDHTKCNITNSIIPQVQTEPTLVNRNNRTFMELSTIVEIFRVYQPKPRIRLPPNVSTIVEITRAYQPVSLQFCKCIDLQQQKLLELTSLSIGKRYMIKSTIVEIIRAYQPKVFYFPMHLIYNSRNYQSLLADKQ